MKTNSSIPTVILSANNRSKKDGDCARMIGVDTCLMRIDSRHYYFTLPVRRLPFFAAIQEARKVILRSSERTFYDIGTPTREPFALNDTDILHLHYSILLYSLNLVSARAVWRNPLPKYFCSYVRELLSAGDDLFRLKIATLNCVAQGLNPINESARVAAVYENAGFSRETSGLYMMLFMSGNVLLTAQKLVERQESVMLSTDTLLDEIQSVMEHSNLRSLCTYAAYTKLAFITNSHRMDAHDLAMELTVRAQQVLMHTRPFLTIDHATNYARATVGTYTNRIINHFTKEENARLIADGHGGHTNRFVQLDEGSMPVLSPEDALIELMDARRAGLIEGV